MKYDRIYIEIGNVCNLQCNFCPEVEREEKLMSADFFRQVIGECSGITREVTLHLMGEPMNHPRLAEFVEICGAQNMPINLTTNGTLLRDLRRREILFSPYIRQINFSLQSVMAQAHPASPVLREKYLQSIFSFIREVFARRPDLYINLRLWNIGANAAGDNIEFLDEIEKEFEVKVVAPEAGGFRKSRRLLNRLYVHFDSRFDWPSLQAPIRQTEGFCHALKSHIGILADGTVVPCCLDKEAVLKLGQIEAGQPRGQLTRILASSRAQKIRSEFDKGRVCEDLCQRCQYIERFTTKKTGAMESAIV